MKKRRKHTQHFVVQVLTLASVIFWASHHSASSGLAFAQSAPTWSYTGSLKRARAGHTATLLTNGKVLVAGGASQDQSAELYDPSTGTWSDTGSLNTNRAGHTATLLPNGKVLVAGGHNFGGQTLNSAELYDPATGTWSYTGNLNQSRVDHTATLLQNGKVLVAGGVGVSTALATAELYDPATGVWSFTGMLVGSLFGGRSYHTATLLQSGKVLVAGGFDSGDFGVYASELYDPTTGTWSVSGSHNTERALGNTATLLQNGYVLAAGDCTAGIFCSDPNSSAELYNPTTGIWNLTGRLNTPRFGHTATLLPNGKVLISGGSAGNSAEIYDVAGGTWNLTANLNAPRGAHTATLLQNGKVLVVGGSGGTNVGALQSAELYDSGSSSTVNPIDDPQFFVRQHYLDFLAREPEPSGLTAWLNVLNSCAAGDTACLHQQRLTTSAAFFGSPEFQLKGYFVFRFYRVAFNRLPEYTEIAADMHSLSGPTPAEVYARKAAFTNAFSQRSEFVNRFGAMSQTEYVAALLNRYGISAITTPDPAQPDSSVKVTLTQAQLISSLEAGTLTRVQVLRAVADSDQVFTAEFNQAFVAMQYFGYLRRTPEVAGYNAWLTYLNANPTDFRTMVRGFVDSIEYRSRFGEP